MNFLKNLRLFVLIAVTFVSQSVLAQKIKYKDLIVLLSTNQFEKAEPFLKRYLKETTDNPNALLYMGQVFQDKTNRMDPLLHTTIMAATLDSALIFYDKAFRTITERELKKNDDYYEAYMRRDPRTGKFVIKLSDVQLFIDDHVKACRDKRTNIIQLSDYYQAAEKSYLHAQAIYRNFQKTFITDKTLFLRATDETLNQLKTLEVTFDSCTNAFDLYRVTNKKIGKTGHNQQLDLIEIKDFARDGSSPADFLKDDLKVWDYKRWSAETVARIEKEIIPLRANLLAYDIELNKLREKVRTDSVSVKNDLTKLVNRILEEQLKKFDADPLPLAVFSIKSAELEYYSDLIADKHVKDSANVGLRLTAVSREIADLKKLDSLSGLAMKRNFDEEAINYQPFITQAFGKTSVLQSNISALNDFAKREVLKKQQQWEAWSQALKWLISGADSIPLFVESNRDLKFKPIVIEQEKLTIGLAYQDTVATGYFYTITPSRIAHIKATFPVEQRTFKKSNLPAIKGAWCTSSSGDTFFVLLYSTHPVENQFKGTLAKLNRTDGMVWTTDLSFELLPAEVTFTNSTGELSIRQSGEGGVNKITVVDKSGKVQGN